MDYETYFRDFHKDTLGVYSYDGDHTLEHQERSLTLADRYLAPGSYIVIDDTTQGAPREATLDFIYKNNGRYEVVLDIPTPNDRHPTFWCGIMVLKKKLRAL